ncbi:MAG: hypothetical protein AAF940_10035 [Pseudomonadota bacterium]
MRRLDRAGTRHLILGGDGFYAITIGNDAQRLQIDLTIAAGANLLSPEEDGQLPDGTLVASALPLIELIELAFQTFVAPDGRQALSFGANGEPMDDLTMLGRIRDGQLVDLQDDRAN